MKVRIPVMLLLGVGVLWAATGPTTVVADRGHERVAVTDDCDTTDPAWDNPDGSEGCLREEGTVTRAEFAFFSVFNPMTPLIPPPGTPLANAVIGHPSWRNDPGYLTLELGERLRVKNTGGRGHTFTEVANYGGGFVAVLNFGLRQARECADPTQLPILAPGARAEVRGLALGNHKFQCCIHPWMRSLVKVLPEEEEDGDRD